MARAALFALARCAAFLHNAQLLFFPTAATDVAPFTQFPRHDRWMQRTPLPPDLPSPSFTRRAALGAGLKDGRLRAKDLSRPFHGVRSQEGRSLDIRERCEAFAMVSGASVVFTGPTAALLWGLPLPRCLEQSDRLHVTAVGGMRAPRARGVEGHSTRRELRVQTRFGVAVAAPADAWCQLGPLLKHDDLIAAGDRLLGRPRPLATMEEIGEAHRRVSWGRGVRRIAHALPHLRPNVYSRRETRLRLLVLRAGLPEPEPNGLIMLHNGTMTMGDLVFREFGVVLEYEGEQHLFDTMQWNADIDRHHDLAEAGWMIIRVTKSTSDSEVLWRTRRALAARGCTAAG